MKTETAVIEMCAEKGSLIDLLLHSLQPYWQCYNVGMEIINFPPDNQEIGASGVCPHCQVKSYFKPVGSAYIEGRNLNKERTRICNGAQCEACKSFVFVVGSRESGSVGYPYVLDAVYPLGRPNDSVDDVVPADIAKDFKEALRCRWIKAYKATVVMCGRALQASAMEMGAESTKPLKGQIDELREKGLITEPLKNFAHAVRLTRNVGAHPDEDGLKDVDEKDADKIIKFTQEYFHHVYVMPALLEGPPEKPPEEK